MPSISTLYNGYTIILEMKKIAKFKRGLTVVFNIEFYNKSDEYIKEFIKEKFPNWELISIIDGE
jgi:hypothetical protein